MIDPAYLRALPDHYVFTVHTGEPVKAILTITPDFQIQTRRELPNRWRRFWYWALLGWRWQKA